MLPRLAGAASDVDSEAALLATMMGAAGEHLRGLADAPLHLHEPSWGPHLHRWGAAFPHPPLLPARHALVPSVQVAFAGDFVEGAEGRAASVEGAALSGLRTAEALVQQMGL